MRPASRRDDGRDSEKGGDCEHGRCVGWQGTEGCHLTFLGRLEEYSRDDKGRVSCDVFAMNQIAENIKSIRKNIERAARAHRHDPAGVTLVAVSKTQPPVLVQAALDAGQRVFGENRVQEAQVRWGYRLRKGSGDSSGDGSGEASGDSPGDSSGNRSGDSLGDVRARYPDLVLHLIGPLQTNKAKEAVALFDVIETVDRPDIVRALVKEMKKQGRDLSCFVQVNTGDEEQKAGVSPQALADLLGLCRAEGLRVEGLMCIPPVDEPPALHFALLRRLAQQHGLAKLSMGMSADYERAVALGATHVRVGTALFGGR